MKYQTSTHNAMSVSSGCLSSDRVNGLFTLDNQDYESKLTNEFTAYRL